MLLEEVARETVLPEEHILAWLQILLERHLEGVVVDFVDLEVDDDTLLGICAREASNRIRCTIREGTTVLLLLL